LTPFLAEVSTLCLDVAHIFVPVITWSYVKRIEIVDDVLGKDFTQAGTVTREWSNASPLIQAGKLQLMLVQRQWAPALTDLHPLLNAELRFDFRDRGMSYNDKIELLAERMHMDVQVTRPYMDLLFSEWISMYVGWCSANDPRVAIFPSPTGVATSRGPTGSWSKPTACGFAASCPRQRQRPDAMIWTNSSPHCPTSSICHFRQSMARGRSLLDGGEVFSGGKKQS
jgi:hypothetical protein